MNRLVMQAWVPLWLLRDRASSRRLVSASTCDRKSLDNGSETLCGSKLLLRWDRLNLSFYSVLIRDQALERLKIRSIVAGVHTSVSRHRDSWRS